MRVSVEIPVFKHVFLEETIRSVFNQTFTDWHLYMLSDGASGKAQEILRRWGDHPKISVRFDENAGIGPSQRKLSAWSRSEYLLPMDDDDVLFPNCLEEMVTCMDRHSTAGIVRARRVFIDGSGKQLEHRPWFPFEPRTMHMGMTCDVHNHSQPALIRRTAYDKTGGWFGFEEFRGAGADCDIFLKIEEVSDIVLLDRVLYGYRLHDNRFSYDLGAESAYEMWRRLADIAIQRRGLNLVRDNEEPPFVYLPSDKV